MVGHQDDSGVVDPGSVLDPVDPSRNQLADGLLTEDVRGHSAAQFMGPRDRRCRDIWRP